MSYTHNQTAEYRDQVLEVQQEVVENRREFAKLFGASGFSVLAAAACNSGDDYVPNVAPVDGENDYYKLMGVSKSRGWKHLSIWSERDPDDRNVWMNYGTSGSIPLSVLRTLGRYHRVVAENPAGPWDFKVSWADVRSYCANDMYGCLPQEMFISFNTTDGMIRTICGIKWNKGDVILMTNNEHAGGLGPLYMVADRFGLGIVEVNIPTGVSKGPGTGGYAEDGTLVARFEAARAAQVAAGKKVRAIMISTPPYTLGWRLEEKELCLWAASKGILSIVDGAHIPGAMPIDLHEMGCDYFSGTAAKWHCCPGQTGYAYVRVGKKGDKASTTFNGRVVTTRDWANPNTMEPFFVVSTAYKHFENVSTGSKEDPAAVKRNAGYNGKFQLGDDIGNMITGEYGVGNPNWATIRILDDVNRVWQGIGRSTIAKYNQTLAQYVRQMLAESSKVGLHALGVDYRTAKGVIPTGLANEGVPGVGGKFPRYLQTGLTSINPFGPNKDYNDDLTPEMSAAQAAANVVVLKRLQAEYGVRIRNNQTKQQSRSNPEKSGVYTDANGAALPADKRTYATPLRISTHLYTTVEEAERLVDGLNNIL